MAKAIVTGWKAIDEALAIMPEKVQTKALRGAIRAGAQRIQADAVMNIVENPSIDKGQLAASLKVRAAKRSRNRIGMQIHTKGAAHANLVEYGTKNMPAEPFLRKAGYGNRDYIQAMLYSDIQEAAKSKEWTFKKSAAGGVTAARRAARKVVTKNRRAKRQAARVRARNR